MSMAETLRKIPQVRRLIERAVKERLAVNVKVEPPVGDTSPHWIYSSVLLKADRRDSLILEAPSAPQGATPFAEAAAGKDRWVEISCSSHVVEGYCRFRAQVIEVKPKLLKISYPKYIERFQRRLSVRIAPTEDFPVLAAFDMAGHMHEIPVISLSTRGMGFVMAADGCLAPGAHFQNLRLSFPDGAQMPRSAKVNELAERDDGLPVVSVIFLDIDQDKDRAIHAYMRDLIEGRDRAPS